MLKHKKLALAVLACIFPVIISYAEKSHSLMKLPNPGLNLIEKATWIEPMAPADKLQFTAWLKIRNKPELDKLVKEVYDPNSPRYHQFLTKEEYEQKYAPTNQVEQAVQNYFTAFGMQAKIINHSVQVAGTVQQIKHALNVQMNYYQYKNKKIYANPTAPQLKPEIAKYIAEITGLSNIHPFYINRLDAEDVTHKHQAHPLNFVWKNPFTPKANPTTQSLNGFSGAQLQTTYNISNIPTVNGSHINGSGQTLVIVDNCSLLNGQLYTRAQIVSDANQYFTSNGINPFHTSGPNYNFAIVNPDGTTYTDANCTASSDFPPQEIAIDIQSSHTIAPRDNTVLVLSNTGTPSGLIGIINFLLQNNFTVAGFPNAYVISNSWSFPETEFQSAILEQTLQLAAAAGISVNFSSGDCGDNSYTSPPEADTHQSKCKGNGTPVVPRYPPTSAYVTAVGGTSMFVDQNYRYAFETVWGTVAFNSFYGAISYIEGSSGGISSIYGPVPWQSSLIGFTAGGYGTINALSGRSVPDIAMLADFNTPLHIVYKGKTSLGFGTSLACPLFSGTLVLVNQVRRLLNKGTPIGQAAPYLYTMNSTLLSSRSLNLITPPAQILSGALPPLPLSITVGQPGSTVITPVPASAFTIIKSGQQITFGWDSSLTIEPENQFWNDAVGVGSPNIPNFVLTMGNI